MIKILPFLLSSAFENIGGKYWPRQILTCNSNGKLDYFERNFHIRFAAITHLKNVSEPHGELDRVECDVILYFHFTENHPHCVSCLICFLLLGNKRRCTLRHYKAAKAGIALILVCPLFSEEGTITISCLFLSP